MNDLPAERNRRILVIDDNRAIHDDFRKILSPDTTAAAALDKTETKLFAGPANVLRGIRYDIDSAYQGQEGVTLVRQALEKGRPYAMAFVDVRMPPGWDGVETTQRILGIDPDIQIVICTAYADYSWEQMFEKIGNRDGLLILKKPFDAVEAFQLAHALTEKWWLHQQSRQKMEELENRVAERTAELGKTNQALQADITGRKSIEEHLRVQTTALDAAANAIVITDYNGTIQSANPAFTALTGYTAQEVVGQNPRILKSGKQDEAFYRNLWQTISSGQVWNGELTNRRKDGSLYVEEMTITPLRNADGVIARYIGIKQDVSGRNRAEAKLKLFRALIDHSSDGIYVMDPVTRRFLDVNESGCRALGYTRDELLALTAFDVTEEGNRALFDATDTRMKKAGHATAEALHRRKDGTTYPVEVSLSPVTLDREYLVAIVRDTTERKRAEESLRKSEEKFQGLFESSRDAIMTLEPPSWKFTSGNPACLKMFRAKNEEQFMSHGPADLSPDRQPDGRASAEKAREMMETALREGSHFFEWTHRRLDGGEFPADVLVTRMEQGGKVMLQATVRDITERKRAEETLRASQQIIEGIINAIPVRVFWKDKNLVYLGCNAIFARDAGFADAKDVIGKDDYQMGWRDQAEKYRGDDRQVIESGCSKLSIEEPQTTPEGNTITILTSKIPLRSSKGEISGVLGTYMDITERKRLEARLFQSQKMETVGKLAGGIAHEFNSILTAIIGQSELLLNDLPPGNPLRKNAAEIGKAADRAATLTRQLLAYGRKQILQPQILDLNSILAGMEGTLRHLLGCSTVMNIAAFPGLKSVKADAGQIEQVIMNMVFNARDAMPNGGQLTLETSNVSFDQESVDRYPELKPGDYVMLAITDTGAGMSEEIKAHVFEPFFTTKGVGQGTGLGLSTCYGIIKQSGGHISVYSEPGRGATFKIYLPQVESRTEIPLQRPDSSALPRGTETILLVEDDPALCEMAVTLLRRLGYTVLAAANGIEALSLKQQRDIGHIDLLFTDVVMPHMSGKELADRMRAVYPHTRILFTSAYTESVVVHQGVLDKGVALLQKPFTPSALAHKLREVLDQPGVPKPDAAQTTFGFTKAPDGVNAP